MVIGYSDFLSSPPRVLCMEPSVFFPVFLYTLQMKKPSYLLTVGLLTRAMQTR